MGEAKRRKSKDPNFGKTEFIHPSQYVELALNFLTTSAILDFLQWYREIDPQDYEKELIDGELWSLPTAKKWPCGLFCAVSYCRDKGIDAVSTPGFYVAKGLTLFEGIWSDFCEDEDPPILDPEDELLLIVAKINEFRSNPLLIHAAFPWALPPGDHV